MPLFVPAHTFPFFCLSFLTITQKISPCESFFFFNCLTTDVFALPVGVCQLHTRLAVLSWMKQRLVTVDSSQTCKSMRVLVLISQKWDVSKLESSYWVNFGRRGRSRWPQGGSAGKERETGRINTAPKIWCHGGGHGGWEWSQAPWSSYVTPSEFPHDLTSGGGGRWLGVAKRTRIASGKAPLTTQLLKVQHKGAEKNYLWVLHLRTSWLFF